MAVEYTAIANKIAEQIRDGKFTDTLPSINTFSKMYSVCPATVKRAISQLKDWEMVSGEQGRCVRVIPRASVNPFFHKNIVVLVQTRSIEIEFYNKVIVYLNDCLDRLHTCFHIFVSEKQFRECGFEPDCVIVIEKKVSKELLIYTPFEKIIKLNYPESGYLSVATDNRQAGYKAIEQIAETFGHKKIGMLTSQLQYEYGCFRDRFLGATDYCSVHKEISLITENVPEEVADALTLLPCVENLFRKDPEISAIFTSSDAFALGVYAYAAKNKLKIPEDFSVIGFDNSVFSRALYPQLSTFQENHDETGKNLLAMIKTILLKQDIAQKNVVISPNIVLRNSLTFNRNPKQNERS